jgi:maleylpyruvate isomerase
VPPTAAPADPREDPVAGRSALSGATGRLLTTARRLDADLLAGPSLCPGWSRGHVLGHLARNADALSHLCAWAATGTPHPMYPSAEHRRSEIEASAGRSPDELVEDLVRSADRLASALDSLPEEAWSRRVRLGPAGAGAEIPASRIGWQRLKEVEIHHVDLDHGYSPSDWPTGFVDRALSQTLRMFRRRGDTPSLVAHVVGSESEPLGTPGGPTVSGPPAAMLAWLTGRSGGDDLAVDPPGSPPVLPAWA